MSVAYINAAFIIIIILFDEFAFAELFFVRIACCQRCEMWLKRNADDPHNNAKCGRGQVRKIHIFETM